MLGAASNSGWGRSPNTIGGMVCNDRPADQESDRQSQKCRRVCPRLTGITNY